MSYLAQSQLEQDTAFSSRVRSCTIEQAQVFKDAADLGFKALADAVLRDDPGPGATMLRMVATAPGLADMAGDPIDQAQIGDQAILSTVQGSWPTVAQLYYAEDGTPI